MLAKRIIPSLDVRDGRVVKGVNFVNIRDAGDPVELARFYSDQGADEIVFLDITATSDGRATVADVVERTAEQVFVPLTVGGHPHPGGLPAAPPGGCGQDLREFRRGEEPGEDIPGGGAIRLPVRGAGQRCPAAAGGQL